MDIFLNILADIFVIAYMIFGVVFVVGLWNYADKVLGFDKKHDDDDEKIVINYKIEDVETEGDERSKLNHDD